MILAWHLKQCRRLGLADAAFWAMTPHECGQIIEQRGIAAHDEQWQLAYKIASLVTFAHHAPKKMPKLKSLLYRESKPQQTPAEMLAMFKKLTGS